MFEELLLAWSQIVSPTNLGFLVLGVGVGLSIGAIPGLGGIVGLTLLIPFVYDFDATGSLAMLIGLAAVASTSDSIPAILFGIPGSVASQASVLDGYPMTQQGQAARALGASFSASALGGVFGAFVLFASIPVLRSVVLQFGSPEFFMLAILGVSMVAVLSQGALIKGLAAGGFGLLLATIGQDPVSGTFRYVFGSTYLWDGLPIVAVALGIFAIPELLDMAAAGGRLVGGSDRATPGNRGGVLHGMLDTLRNGAAVVRSSVLGVFVGIVPGLGGTVVDWFAYAFAKLTSKNPERFGTGDVRGVIAVDAAANAKEGGALVTTVAFGVPGSITMALILGAFQILGVVPGPAMLTTEVGLTLQFVWTLVLANFLGAGICLLFARQLARVARADVNILFPALLFVVFLGAYQATRSLGDLVTLMALGGAGWAMKRAGWPRPPLLLGFILGGSVQSNLYLSVQRYGAAWILEPLPLLIGSICLLSLGAAFFFGRAKAPHARVTWRLSPQFGVHSLLTVALLCAAAYAVWEARQWSDQVRLFPLSVGAATAVLLLLQLIRDLFGDTDRIGADKALDVGVSGSAPARGFLELGAWLLAFFLATVALGLTVSGIALIGLFLAVRAKFRIWWAAASALVSVLAAYWLFDRILGVGWPTGLLTL